mmetsp:Transcript_91581/g.191437  ORF Transcript_91581/g.191437 Transcript_91581/m.191437 type:complete len:130 (+) Transcript_91581:81-470(+)
MTCVPAAVGGVRAGGAAMCVKLRSSYFMNRRHDCACRDHATQLSPTLAWEMPREQGRTERQQGLVAVSRSGLQSKALDVPSPKGDEASYHKGQCYPLCRIQRLCTNDWPGECTQNRCQRHPSLQAKEAE